MATKKVLVVHYQSSTGQVSDIVSHLAAPLFEDDTIDVTEIVLQPKTEYRFPWPILRFFDTFPECIYLDPPANKPPDLDGGERFDLVILGYQVWFLTPSLPMIAFLKSAVAHRILKETPVVTLVACRDMWLLAQERMKELLTAAGATLVGHVALVDEAGSVGSFLATPLWMLSGFRGPAFGGLLPRAGVKAEQVTASRRFGERILSALKKGTMLDETLLRGLDAVRVNTHLIATEKAARRGFLVWGKLLRSLGVEGAWMRQPVVAVYIVFLVLLLLTVLPISALLKTVAAPLMRRRIAAQRAYFSWPSGSHGK